MRLHPLCPGLFLSDCGKAEPSESLPLGGEGLFFHRWAQPQDEKREDQGSTGQNQRVQVLGTVATPWGGEPCPFDSIPKGPQQDKVGAPCPTAPKTLHVHLEWGPSWLCLLSSLSRCKVLVFYVECCPSSGLNAKEKPCDGIGS